MVANLDVSAGARQLRREKVVWSRPWPALSNRGAAGGFAPSKRNPRAYYVTEAEAR